MVGAKTHGRGFSQAGRQEVTGIVRVALSVLGVEEAGMAGKPSGNGVAPGGWLTSMVQPKRLKIIKACKHMGKILFMVMLTRQVIKVPKYG